MYVEEIFKINLLMYAVKQIMSSILNTNFLSFVNRISRLVDLGSLKNKQKYFLV
jgi:hypothetical protein